MTQGGQRVCAEWTRGYDVKLRHSRPGRGAHGVCDLAGLLCTIATATGTCSDLKWAARLIVLALRECVVSVSVSKKA